MYKMYVITSENPIWGHGIKVYYVCMYVLQIDIHKNLLNVTNYSLIMFLIAGQMRYPRFKDCWEISCVAKLWHCSGQLGKDMKILAAMTLQTF